MSANDSVFVALRSYRPRAKRDSLEDFVTEAFCSVLRRNPGVAHSLLQWVYRECSEESSLTISDEITWHTQYALGSLRVDMLAEVGGKVFLFEHKVWSGLTPEQIDNYAKAAAKKWSNNSVFVVAITPQRQIGQAKPDAHFTWVDIFGYIQMWLSITTSEAFLADDFQALLVSEGLGPVKPVNPGLLSI